MFKPKNIAQFNYYTSSEIKKSVRASLHLHQTIDKKDISFDYYMEKNRRKHAKEYFKYIQKQVNKAQEKKSFLDEIRDKIQSHLLYSLSLSTLIDVYYSYYNLKKDVSAYLKPLIIYNLLKRVENVADFEFNLFLLKAYKNRSKLSSNEEKILKLIETLNLNKILNDKLDVKAPSVINKRLKI